MHKSKKKSNKKLEEEAWWWYQEDLLELDKYDLAEMVVNEYKKDKKFTKQLIKDYKEWKKEEK